MSALDEHLKRHSQRIAEREAATVREMLAAYEPVERDLARTYRELQAKIKAAQKAGETISPSWFYRTRRLKLLLNQVREQIERFGRAAAPVIEREQREAIRIAIEQTGDVLRVVGPESGIRGIGSTLTPRVVETAVGVIGDGSPLLNYFQETLAPAVAEMIKTEVIKAAAIGTDFNTIARRLQAAGDITRQRALSTARTEVSRVRRETTRAIYQENDDIVEGWEWVASKSSRTCVVCLAMDGRVFKLKDEFPQHVNCLVSGTVVSSPETHAATRRYYEGEVVEIETSLGFRLTVTPNHPIMTAHGWVAADLVNEGFYVVSTGDGQGVCVEINPHVDNKPAAVDQVFVASRERSGVRPKVVPHSPANFHGDGEGGNIDVVFIDRLWGRKPDPPFSEPLAEMPFIFGRSDFGLLMGQSPFDQFGMGPFRAANGIMSSGGISEVLIWGPLCHHHAISVDNGPGRASSFDQSATDNGPRYSEMIAESIFGDAAFVTSDNFTGGNFDTPGPGDPAFLHNSVKPIAPDVEACRDFINRHSRRVRLDRVVNVRRHLYRGHVFNLETSTGYYIANGIVTHNCRCTIIPVIIGLPRPPRTIGSEWFDRQPDGIKKKILGQDALDAYKNGDVQLKDFVGWATSKEFGRRVYRKKLAKVLADVNIAERRSRLQLIATPKDKLKFTVSAGKIDPAAEALASRIGGLASIQIEGFGDREFDAVSKTAIAQTTASRSVRENPANYLTQRRRRQIEATLEAARQTKRIAIFEFTSDSPADAIRKRIKEKADAIGVKYRIISPDDD